MKKKLIIGSLLAVFLLMMFPSISAMEYDAVEKAYEEKLTDLLNVKDIDPEQQCIIRKIFRLILKIIKLPIRIIKKILRLLFRIATIPLRIFLFILEILTPFRDIKIFPFRCLKRFHHKH